MMIKLAMAAAFVSATVAGASLAAANCSIHNDTSFDFKVESGNVSNQSVGPHTSTSIHSGRIIGKDDKAGKTVSGSCKDGDSLEIKDDHGVPVLTTK